MDTHPIEHCPAGKTPEERIAWLELHLAELWDQVWWMNLPPEKRAEYESQGFRAPIERFYGR